MPGFKQDCLTMIALEMLRITGDKSEAGRYRDQWRRRTQPEVLEELRRLRELPAIHSTTHQGDDMSEHTFELATDAADRHHHTVQDYCTNHELESSRQVAAHFGVSQATAARWLNQEVWVVTDGFDGPWIDVYMEKVLKSAESEEVS